MTPSRKTPHFRGARAGCRVLDDVKLRVLPPQVSGRRPPQLAGFWGCVSVSADGLDAIVGSLSLGRDPLPDVGSPPLGRLD